MRPSTFRLVLPSDAGVATNLDVWVPFGDDLKAGAAMAAESIDRGQAAERLAHLIAVSNA